MAKKNSLEKITSAHKMPLKDFIYNFYSEGFCFSEDLAKQGFQESEISQAINSGEVVRASWPKEKPQTEVYWLNNNKKIQGRYDKLEFELTLLFLEQDPYETKPLGEDVESLSQKLGDSRLALFGLVYGREKDILKEISEENRIITNNRSLASNDLLIPGKGPVYILRGSSVEATLDYFTPCKKEEFLETVRRIEETPWSSSN
ncbi:MAG TPA: hypothetical protein PLK34_01430 [Candidatus Pacearchaeota archaeon]|nr:hypothetical protein [Candidatus Pacearchaeota archaeon]